MQKISPFFIDDKTIMKHAILLMFNELLFCVDNKINVQFILIPLVEIFLMKLNHLSIFVRIDKAIIYHRISKYRSTDKSYNIG